MVDVEALARYVDVVLPEAWVSCAPEAERLYRPDWLDQYDFDAILDYYEFPKEYYYDRLHRELELLRRDEKLNFICWLMHYTLFHADLKEFRSVWKWASANRSIGGRGTPTTCAVALLTGQPMHAKLLVERDYDEEQVAIHKRGVRGSWTGEHEHKGVDGMRFSLMVWGSYYVKGAIVQLGRLQYEMGLKAHPKLEALLGSNIQVASIHIPGGKPLTVEDVDASVELARRMLFKYFPDLRQEDLVFCTQSWLLSPQLREFLPESSNIIKFQDRFTLVSTTPAASSFLGFAFNEVRLPGTFDYAELPEDTYLRRMVKQRLIAGTPLESGYGYFR